MVPCAISDGHHSMYSIFYVSFQLQRLLSGDPVLSSCINHAGIALLHLHIALSLGHEGKKSGAPFDRELHLQRAAELLYPILSQLPRREATFLCGAAGPLAVGAAVFHYLESPKDSQHCIKLLTDLAPNVLGDHSLPSELLYGRVGYLYALLFVKKHCPGAIKEELLVQVGREGRDYCIGISYTEQLVVCMYGYAHVPPSGFVVLLLAQIRCATTACGDS